MRKRILLSLFVCALASSVRAQHFDTLRFAGQEWIFAQIPAGGFVMGEHAQGSYRDLREESRDELPTHPVQLSAFRMGICEVTNAQFEVFFPEHRGLRGVEGFSRADDEAVTQVSWEEAQLFCQRLSAATGRHFRLPTEAEWEYACRCGTSTDFSYGNVLPVSEWHHQRTERYKVPVSLSVMQGQANAWGLYAMHGGVEEWCQDWYGPYSSEAQEDPLGAEHGEFRVTRGGSHNTPERYLRSVNRSAMLPSDRSSLVGFRLVETPCPPSGASPAMSAAFFLEPQPYVIAPEDPSVPFYAHNHQPAVVPTRDGGLLAIWFSCEEESGREMVVLSSRWSPQTARWSPARLFYKVPDRNMTGAALLSLGSEIVHFNGVGDAGEWRNLVIVSRRSEDDAESWTPSRLSEAEHRERHQVIAGPIVLSDGTVLLACDAGPGGDDGTSIHLSQDGGRTFSDPGGTIAGIHAGVVERADGSLLAFGRGNSIDGRMPQSLSYDRGKTWQYSASIFPPIGSGQRLVLRRLQEGPLLLISFGEQGMFAALSYDEGQSWPQQKLLSGSFVDAEGHTVTSRRFDGGAWTGSFTMDPEHAEPAGYLACCQTSDGTIHLLSSRLHYRFNLAWLQR